MTRARWTVFCAFLWASPAMTLASPFKVDLRGMAHLSPTADPCLVLNAETGTGVSKVLGDLVWQDMEVVNFCSVPDGIGVVSQFTLTTAAGDKLYGVLETTGSFVDFSALPSTE